jgi:NADH dehydrogenase
LAAEGIVRAEERLQHTIVRPTLVYDESGGQEFMLFRQYLDRFKVVPFIGPVAGPRAARKRPVHAADVVDGLARILGNDASLGRTYNLSGGEVITLGELGRLVLALQGRPKRFVSLPVPLCRVVAMALGAVMKRPPLTPYAIAGFTNHADLDPSDAMRDLGYRPRGVRAGLAACLSAGRRAPGPDPGRARVAPGATGPNHEAHDIITRAARPTAANGRAP